MIKTDFNMKIKNIIILYTQSIVNRFINNGWRRYDGIKDWEKEQCFHSLPKTKRYYDIVVNNEIEYRYYYNGCISSDRWVDVNVTHFRLSKRHKLPKR